MCNLPSERGPSVPTRRGFLATSAKRPIGELSCPYNKEHAREQGGLSPILPIAGKREATTLDWIERWKIGWAAEGIVQNDEAPTR